MDNITQEADYNKLQVPNSTAGAVFLLASKHHLVEGLATAEK